MPSSGSSSTHRPPSAPLGGNNLVLASLLAILSYVPFEWVAKGSLIVCAFLFIVDPFPPISRLLAIVSLFVVYGLTKLHNQHQEQEQAAASSSTAAAQEEEITILSTSTEKDKKTE
mmetsp:Transcript_42796/g.120940  ORF Transcript_42796/g.120940 Transcript_42796/m.120940 type:complete len:116 (+) Transcript_42796:159-506(+)